MQWKLLGIINVGSNATGQLLIMYSAFVKCWRKNGNTMNARNLSGWIIQTYADTRTQRVRNQSVRWFYYIKVGNPDGNYRHSVNLFFLMRKY